MEINLPAEVEAIITRNIETGGYHSPTGVIVQALWLLDGWNDSERKNWKNCAGPFRKGWTTPVRQFPGKSFLRSCANGRQKRGGARRTR